MADLPSPDPSFLTLPDGRRIAHVYAPGTGPLVVFLPGYMSDMAGSKASAVMAECQAAGRACLLLDYSGCGQSDGDFADGTLSRWREEVLALIDHVGGDRIVLVGSSMGGWLMLLVALELGDLVAGLIGIAAAPDFTDWGFEEEQKVALRSGRTVFEDNPYGPEPTPTHPGFWQDGERQLVLETDIPIAAPVRLLHGQRDGDVPWETALRLAAALRSSDVQVTLVKDGDHRLSRADDIALLLATLEALSMRAT